MATIGDVTIRIGASTKQLEYQLKKAEKSLQATATKLQNIGTNLSLGVTAPILLAGGASFKMASNVEESLNKVRVAFGDSAKGIENFTDTTLTSFGIAKGSALDMAAFFGDMATSMGLPQDAAAEMSKALVSLAGDVASFKNLPIGEVQTALGGIFTGETESLKKMGVAMQEENVKAYALAKGITKLYKDMSLAEKTTLRYQYVTDALKNSTGDFARTQDGAANQMRIMQESTKELAASFGAILLPIITPIIAKANELLKSFRELSPETKKTIVILAGIAAALGPVIIILGQTVTAVGALQIAWVKMGAGLLTVGKGFAGLGVALPVLAAIGAAVYVIYKNWDSVVKIMKDVGNYFIDLYNESVILRASIQGIVLAFKQIANVVRLVFDLIINVGKLAIDSLVLGFSTVGKLFKAVITGNFKDIPDIISGAYSKGFNNAENALNRLGNDFEKFSNTSLDNTKSAINNTFSNEPIARFGNSVKEVFKDVKQLTGLSNLLGGVKTENKAPVGVLKTKTENTTTSNLNTNFEPVKKEALTLQQEISNLKQRIEKLSLAYQKTPTTGILNEINKQVDLLKSKERTLENSEALIQRLSGERVEVQPLEILPPVESLDTSLSNIGSYVSSKLSGIGEKLSKALTPTFNTSSFSEFTNSLNGQLSNLERQFDNGLLSGLEYDQQRLQLLNETLTRLRADGFGELSKEVTDVKDKINNIGGGGFEQLSNSVGKINSSLSTVGNVIGTLGKAFNDFTQAQIDKIDAKEQKEIESIKNSGLNEEEKQKRISEVEKKAEKERRAAQRRLAISNKLQSIFSATVSMFQGIASALALGPAGLPLIPFITGLGLAQIAAIAATPLPSLAIGTDYVRSDGLAELHRGEAVVPASVVGGGFTGGGRMELHSVIRGNDIHLINEQNKQRAYRMK
jgi:hypothetical protein